MIPNVFKVSKNSGATTLKIWPPLKIIEYFDEQKFQKTTAVLDVSEISIQFRKEI